MLIFIFVAVFVVSFSARIGWHLVRLRRSPVVSARVAYISALGQWVLVIEERCKADSYNYASHYTRVHIHKLPEIKETNGRRN